MRREAGLQGRAFAFDDTIEHEAWNRSEVDRAVLIIDVWNPYLSDHERAMICRLYGSADIQRSLAQGRPLHEEDCRIGIVR